MQLSDMMVVSKLNTLISKGAGVCGKASGTDPTKIKLSGGVEILYFPTGLSTWRIGCHKISYPISTDMLLREVDNLICHIDYIPARSEEYAAKLHALVPNQKLQFSSDFTETLNNQRFRAGLYPIDNSWTVWRESNHLRYRFEAFDEKTYHIASFPLFYAATKTEIHSDVNFAVVSALMNDGLEPRYVSPISLLCRF